MQKFIILLICFGIFNSSVNAGEKERIDKIKHILGIIEKYHIQPKPFQKEQLKNACLDFLLAIDNEQLFFTQAEANELLQKSQVDADLAKGAVDFFTAASALYSNRLIEFDHIAKSYLASPLNYGEVSKYKFHNSGLFDVVKTEEERKTRIKKSLKQQCIDRMVDLCYRDSLNRMKFDSLMSNEVLARETILKSNTFISEWVKENPTELEEHLFDEFLNQLVMQFDPHTNFFSPMIKKEFEKSLSKDVLLFGFTVDQNENKEFYFSNIMPGGAAWKSNQIHEGDVLLELKVKNKVIVPVKIGAKKFHEELDKIQSETVEIKIRKTNGVVKQVKLVKEKVEVEENIVRGYVLNGPSRIGYIALPSFYTDMGDKGGLGCANDVAKEIIKLESAKKLDGLILDLRYNGGGSLEEAIALSGIFIDGGPMLVSAERQDKPKTLKDPNMGAAYAGPLMVMINGGSASASEMVAGTLQDYNRALIIGQRSYGKATAQTVVPVDTSMMYGKKLRGGEEDGFLKLTIGKIYRVNGTTHQKEGVIPQIVIPEELDNMMDKESDEKNALIADVINKKVYYQPFPAIDYDLIKSKSLARIGSDTVFQKITSLNNKYKQSREIIDNEISLNIKEYFNSYQKLTELLIQLDKCSYRKTLLYKAESSIFDQNMQKLKLHSGNIDLIIKEIEEDVVLEEAYQILNNLIKN